MTEGERWAASQLEELRAGGYTPGAWRRFLRASFSRAADTRRRRPELARQASQWSLAWLLVACGARIWPVRTLFPRVPWRREALWWLSSSAMLRWHLGMVEGAAGQPRERLSAPDALTLARLWLSPRVARSERNPRRLRSLLAVGCATDVLDGPLARRRGTTRLGRDLDPIVDVCFYASATAAARRADFISAGAAGVVALRYMAAVSYVTGSYLGAASRPPNVHLGPERAAAALLPAGLLLAAGGRGRAGSRLAGGASLSVLFLQALGSAWRFSAWSRRWCAVSRPRGSFGRSSPRSRASR